MKRSIILFLISFLTTCGLIAGVGYYLNSRGLLTIGKPAAAQPQKPAEPVAAEPEKPAEPAQEEPTAPEDVTPEETPQEDAETPVTTEEEPTAPEETTPAVPEKPVPPALQQAPRSSVHACALETARALASADPAAALAKLQEAGSLSPEAAEVLSAWAGSHEAAAVQEVGTGRRADGTEYTRYRIHDAKGGTDVVVDVEPAEGGARVVRAFESPREATATPQSDSMAVTEAFVAAVKRGDMAAACGLVRGREVSNATVAGLCMIFEEGAFSLRETAPIRGTFENGDRAGYLVYLTSAAAPANVGMELQQAADGWHVAAVALDNLLSTYEKTAHAEGDCYFPIVKNPKGGDSLALYFAFDHSELTPRSLRQLQIVAELLKQSQGKLNISGHTDDVGSERYNLTLSQRRAESVRNALVGFGVAADKISTEGLGKSQPRRTYSEQDSEQQVDYIRGENRRAEIYLDFVD